MALAALLLDIELADMRKCEHEKLIAAGADEAEIAVVDMVLNRFTAQWRRLGLVAGAAVIDDMLGPGALQ
jgi:hypothetical protein